MTGKRSQTGTFGKSGEEIATSHLIARGYRILARNYRFRRYEIDIVARKENVLVFIEVKTRSSRSFGSPLFSITHTKTKRIIEAATAYVERGKLAHLQVRFDVITLFLKDGSAVIDHIENAFQIDFSHSLLR